jgi:LmbE family N-acetylglucosaminyl deacetylase
MSERHGEVIETAPQRAWKMRWGSMVEGRRVEPVAPLGTPGSAFPAVAPVDEAAWGAWARGLTRFALEGHRVVVVAPHPDDETLGCGGLVHELMGRGSHVQVVTVTNGEGSHRAWPDLASVRRAEQISALRSLGVVAAPVFLGLPDGGLVDRVDELADQLEELVADADADVIVAPWARDGHGDHDAVGRVAARVGARTGAIVVGPPGGAGEWAGVEGQTRPAWQRFDLWPSTRRAKADAMARYRSQISDEHGPAVLGGEVLGRSGRSYEVYARVG